MTMAHDDGVMGDGRYMNDPEIGPILQKVMSKMMGGMGGAGGMPGMGGMGGMPGMM